jgi:hypothetical protein
MASPRSDTAAPLHAVPGLLQLRPEPVGFPEARPQPPIVAESGDPFTLLRIVELVARVERGRPIRIDDLVDALNAAHLDWLFSRAVVADGLIGLQANWMADYRNQAGFELGSGPYGGTLTIEDSARVDPWLINQAQRAIAACRDALAAFSRQDRLNANG